MTVRSELVGKQPEWLLDLVVNGRPFRFATAPIEVARADGEVLEYRDGLQDIEAGIAADGSADRSLSITLDASESWDELVAAFLSFERAPVVLRRWFEGQLLEQARVLIEGQVDGLRYGDASEPIAFQVLRQVRAQSRKFPTPPMVVDETTWPSVDGRLLGVYYPVIIGAPGTTSGGGASSTDPATEGMLVAANTLLVAGHRVRASQVRVFDFTDDGVVTANVLPVSVTQDDVGRTVAYVDMATFSGTVGDGRAYYVGWGVSDGGGLVSPITGGLLRGGADIIEWALRTFTDVRIDAARFAGARQRLNAYLFDTLINDPVEPLEWLNSEILPVLPVEPRQGEEGLYYYVRRWDAEPHEATVRLDADLGQVQRESEIEVRSEQIVNEVTVSFGPNRQSGRFRSRVIVGARAGRRALDDEFEPGFEEADSRVIASYRAALSQEKYGIQPINVELNSVWDRRTAVRHAQDIIAAQALPRRFVTYSAQTELEVLDVGDVVILNDSSVHLADVVCLVLDVIVGGPEVRLELEILDDPVLIRRAV